MPLPSKPDESSGVHPPDLVARTMELLDNVVLLNVRPCNIHADIERGVAPGTHVNTVEVDLQLSFAAGIGVYGNRFDYGFVLKDDDDEKLGTVKFSLLIDYEVTEDFAPDHDAAEFLTSTTGYFAAYPYARELFQSLAARLQFDPVVLGLIKRDDIRPGTISVAPPQLLDA